MKIIFYSISDDRKKIRKNVSNKIGETTSLRIKENTSVMNPTIDVTAETVGNWAAVNYAYIPDFGRYYFVDSVELRNDGIVAVTMTVDVLKSYEADLLNTSFFIARSESINSKWYIDTERPLTNRRVTSYKAIGKIDQDSTGRKFAITVAGGSN